MLEVLQKTSFSSERMAVLTSLVNFTSAADMKMNSSKIINFFKFSDEKKEAAAIIAKYVVVRSSY